MVYLPSKNGEKEESKRSKRFMMVKCYSSEEPQSVDKRSHVVAKS